MAKLNARGRTEVLRVFKEENLSDNELGITWRRWTRAYMSDNNVLEKYDVRFKPSQYDPKGKFHSYGWKRKEKLFNGTRIDDIIHKYRSLGWTIERV